MTPNMDCYRVGGQYPGYERVWHFLVAAKRHLSRRLGSCNRKTDRQGAPKNSCRV